MRSVTSQRRLSLTELIRAQRANLPPYAWIIAIGALAGLALASMCVLGVGLLIGGVYATGNILPGVTVQGNGIKSVSVGGMSPADAAAQLSSIPPDRTLTLHDRSRTFNIAAADLRITADGTATANKAAELERLHP